MYMIGRFTAIQQDFNLEVSGYWIVESYKICKSVLRNCFQNSLAGYLFFDNFNGLKNMIFTLVFLTTRCKNNYKLNCCTYLKEERFQAIQGVMVTKNQNM